MLSGGCRAGANVVLITLSAEWSASFAATNKRASGERGREEGIEGARRGLLTAFPYKERAGGGKRRGRGWEGRGGGTGGRGNTRRYYERHQGGGEKFGRRDKDGGIKADKAAEDGGVRTKLTPDSPSTASTRFSGQRLTDPAQVGLTPSRPRSRLGFHSFSPAAKSTAATLFFLYFNQMRDGSCFHRGGFFSCCCCFSARAQK